MKRPLLFPELSLLSAWLCLAAFLLAAPAASAVSLTVSAAGAGTRTGGVGALSAGAGDVLTFAVGLDVPTSLNGYELFFSFDEVELGFLDAEPLFPSTPLDFTIAPDPGGNPEVRVAQLSPTALTTEELFAVRFENLGPATDGLADVAVFAGPGGLSPGSVDLENPSGAGFDVVVPESSTALLLALGTGGLVRRHRPPA